RRSAYVHSETALRQLLSSLSIQRPQVSTLFPYTTLFRSQKAEIEERPTQDLDAFELYVQAKAIVDSYINATDVRAALLQAHVGRSEEHTSELQSRGHLVCRLLVGKKENSYQRSSDVDACR